MWEDFSLREKILLLLLLFLLLGAVLWKAAPALLSKQPGGVVEEVDLDALEQDSDTAPEPEMITVHLVGAVKNPGVYDLPAGARVYELLEAGGGAAKKADLESVNLARPLYDGEQVQIYAAGEGPAGGEGAAEEKININKATVEELQTLPSIGEVRAQGIIEYRDKNGPFTAIEELMDVSGIGAGIFNQIKDQVTIY